MTKRANMPAAKLARQIAASLGVPRQFVQAGSHANELAVARAIKTKKNRS